MKAHHYEVTSVMDALRRLVRRLRLTASRLEVDSGLSPGQFFVLQQLSRLRSLSTKQLALRLHCDQASAAAVASKLANRGLAFKLVSPGDGRPQWRLSQEGKALLTGRPEAFQSGLLKALHRLAPQELAGLRRGLERLLREAGLDQETPDLMYEESGDPGRN